MTKKPPTWASADLARDVESAVAQFRTGRLAITTDWEAQYASARQKFELLFDKLGSLDRRTVTDSDLADVYAAGLGEALRYLAGPPVSDDDLQVLADVVSLRPRVLGKDPVALRKVLDMVMGAIDPHRFPWLASGVAPTAAQKDAALMASAVLLAAQRLATARRNDGKAAQEARVKQYLRDIGFEEVRATGISTIVNGPQKMQYCGECMLGVRKADVVVRLHDTRLMAIECKVSNSALNSVKRVNNDAAAKAEYWIKQFGIAQVVPVAVLAGVYKVLNLEQAQSRGLSIFWSHDLGKMGSFIDSTMPAA